MAVNQKVLAQRRRGVRAVERDVTGLPYGAVAPRAVPKRRAVRTSQPVARVRVRRFPATGARYDLAERRARALNPEFGAVWRPYQRRA